VLIDQLLYGLLKFITRSTSRQSVTKEVILSFPQMLYKFTKQMLYSKQ